MRERKLFIILTFLSISLFANPVTLKGGLSSETSKIKEKSHGNLESPATLTFNSNIALNNFGCDFKDMEAFYLKELGVKSVKIEYKIQRMKNPNLKGFIRKISPGRYFIAMAKGLEASEKRITLAHELVHVRQIEQGLIDNKEFKKDYHSRSFEDEAFRLSLPMAVKFYTKHKC